MVCVLPRAQQRAFPVDSTQRRGFTLTNLLFLDNETAKEVTEALNDETVSQQQQLRLSQSSAASLSPAAVRKTIAFCLLQFGAVSIKYLRDLNLAMQKTDHSYCIVYYSLWTQGKANRGCFSDTLVDPTNVHLVFITTTEIFFCMHDQSFNQTYLCILEI